MCEPFIENHQFNLIRRHAKLLIEACRTAVAPQAAESVRDGVRTEIWSMFPDAAEQQLRLLENVTEARTEEDIRRGLLALEPCLTAFPQVTEKRLRQLFPKVRKLRVPDLSAVDWRRITYLSWTDAAANRMFLVSVLDGRLVGIEGRFTPVHKKSVCFLCGRHSEVVLFSAVSKVKPAHAPSDYYKAVGNYLCLDGGECNRHITGTAALDRFVREVAGSRES